LGCFWGVRGGSTGLNRKRKKPPPDADEAALLHRINLAPTITLDFIRRKEGGANKRYQAGSHKPPLRVGRRGLLLIPRGGNLVFPHEWTKKPGKQGYRVASSLSRFSLVSCKRRTDRPRSHQHGTPDESSKDKIREPWVATAKTDSSVAPKARMQAWFQALAFASVVTWAASWHGAAHDPV
jgi:hypothetical protein